MGISNWLAERAARKQADKLLSENPIVQAAAAKSRQRILDMDLQSHFSPETLEKVSMEIFGEVGQIAGAADKVTVARHLLTEATLRRAKLQVLVMEPPPVEDPTGLIAMGGVTGELKAHLLEIAEADDDLRTWLYGIVEEPDYDSIWNCILMRYWIDAWKAEVLNACRWAIGDHNPVEGRDWYLPFLHAVCVTEESHYRQKIGLPSVLPNDDCGVETLRYSTFMNIVLDGERYPDLVFRDHYKQDGDPLMLAVEKLREP